MDEYSSYYYFKKKIATVVIAILFLMFSLFFKYLRDDMIVYKLDHTEDLKNLVHIDDNVELSSYMDITSTPIEFANNPNDKENAYFMLLKDKHLYVIFANREKINSITSGELTKGYRVAGVTQKIRNKLQGIIIESSKEIFDVSLKDFDKDMGTIYLDATKDQYALTTAYNTLILIFNLMGGVTFAFGFIGAIIKGINRT